MSITALLFLQNSHHGSQLVKLLHDVLQFSVRSVRLDDLYLLRDGDILLGGPPHMPPHLPHLGHLGIGILHMEWCLKNGIRSMWLK